MAKTSAERQAAYRAKRTGQDGSERRLNTWVNAETYTAIEKLAICYGVTRKSIIELLVANESSKLKELMPKEKVSSEAGSTGQARALRRNKKQTVSNKNKVQKKPTDKKLPRNIESKPQPLGAQYEFEL